MQINTPCFKCSFNPLIITLRQKLEQTAGRRHGPRLVPAAPRLHRGREPCEAHQLAAGLHKGEGAIGVPHRAQISRFELFERILLLKLDKRFPVELFEATV